MIFFNFVGSGKVDLFGLAPTDQGESHVLLELNIQLTQWEDMHDS